MNQEIRMRCVEAAARAVNISFEGNNNAANNVKRNATLELAKSFYDFVCPPDDRGKITSD